MMRDFDFIVAGAGVTGATFAAAAAERGIVPAGRIALIDARMAPAPAVDADLDVRVFALNRASQRLLGSIGAWDCIEPRRRFAYERMRVWDARSGARSTAAVQFDAAEIGEPDLGHIVDGRALQACAVQAARERGVILIEAALDSIEVTELAVNVSLQDGRKLRAGLLIAADGRSSKVRTSLGFSSVVRSYAQTALVGNVKTSKPHEATAWQRFLPEGPLAFLPLADGRSSMVWTLPTQRALELHGPLRAELDSALTTASDALLGACQVGATATFPLMLQYSTQYVAPRCALLADAAHTVHPLAGQGLNLGLADCEALLAALGGAPVARMADLSVLRVYERARKTRNLVQAGAFDALNRLFSNDDELLGRLRTTGLAAVARAPWARRLFARRALGIA